MKSLVRLHSKGDSLLTAQRALQEKSLKACCLQITRRPGDTRQRKGALTLAAIGAFLIVASFVVLCVNPIKLIIRSKLSLTEGSFMDEMWRHPPVDIYVKIYLFNLTNPDEFLAGREKMRVEQLGPFVYKEVLENTEAVYNPNGTVTYIPKRSVIYMESMSTDLTLDTVITVPNVPLLAFASRLSDAPMLPNLALRSLTLYLHSRSIIQVSVYDLLWGYDDPLVRLASHIAPLWISFDKFGFLDRLLDEGVNVVTMGSDGDAKHRINSQGKPISPMTIDLYNGSPGLAHWGYQADDNSTHKECNTLQGLATEGTIVHKNISPNDTFLIYRKVFCRTLRLEFQQTGLTKQGLNAFWYKLPGHVFDSMHPENSCFCPTQQSCLPMGLSDLTPCYYNFPAAVSLPHFLDADPKLLSDIDGLLPDREKHETRVAIQPDFGIPLETHARVQVNIVVKKTKYNPKVAPFNDLVVPIFWVELSLDELPNSINSLLRLLTIAPALQNMAICGVALAGAVFLGFAVRSLMCITRSGLYSPVAARRGKDERMCTETSS